MCIYIAIQKLMRDKCDTVNCRLCRVLLHLSIVYQVVCIWHILCQLKSAVTSYCKVQWDKDGFRTGDSCGEGCSFHPMAFRNILKMWPVYQIHKFTISHIFS